MSGASPGLPALLDPKQLAAYLGVPVATIYKWRATSGGPKGYRVGKHVRYRLSDVEEWLESNADRPAAS